jgi:molecular chaperone DnaJ
MQPKDYYKILNVSPTAGSNEIRKAFRSLALKYHPDKTNGDRYKEAMFREVQEAYETLSDQKSREEYNYKRWYTRSLGKSFTEPALTPVQILAETQRLADYIASVNDLQVDFDLLSARIRTILSDDNLGILSQFNDELINQKVIRLLLRTCDPLPLNYVEPISILMAKVAANDNVLLKEIKEYTDNRFSSEYWQKRAGWLVALLVVFICWLMYLYAS